jgi:hypothetical protein
MPSPGALKSRPPHRISQMQAPPRAPLPLPVLDMASLFSDLQGSEQKTSLSYEVKLGSSFVLKKPYDPSFKPQAYRKHLSLPDEFRATAPATLSDRCSEAVSWMLRQVGVDDQSSD